MNIALIDDQLSDLRDAKTFLRKYFAENAPEVAGSVRIETFNDAGKFLSKFERGAYDLIILDIFMRPLNGIQVAQIIRSRDSNAAIIFLSNSEDFLSDGYKVFAVGYFLKPLAENVEQFTKTFRYVFPRLMENQRRLTLSVKGNKILVPHRNIRYVDIDEHHHLTIHTTDEKISPNMTYEEIFYALKDDARFLECYHRIIVNMNFIRRMEEEDFLLDDDTKIPISRRKSKAAKLQYMSHLIAANPNDA